MKKYSTWILVGIIILLAVLLIGALLYLRNQPPQGRSSIPPVVVFKTNEPASSNLGPKLTNHAADRIQ
jgi:hypothetical protein